MEARVLVEGRILSVESARLERVEGTASVGRERADRASGHESRGSDRKEHRRRPVKDLLKFARDERSEDRADPADA